MFVAPFVTPFQKPFPQQGAASVSWWLSGGISAGNAIAAYQPKGAASLAASYVNQANPGTYDVTLSGTVTLGVDGWTWTGSPTSYLNTGYAPNSNDIAVIVRFSNMSDSGNVRTLTSGLSSLVFSIRSRYNIYTIFRNGDTQIITDKMTETFGVLAASGQNAYKDGVFIDLIPSGASESNNLVIGQGINTAVIQAFAIYNTTITAPQVLAVTNAMNAL